MPALYASIVSCSGKRVKTALNGCYGFLKKYAPLQKPCHSEPSEARNPWNEGLPPRSKGWMILVLGIPRRGRLGMTRFQGSANLSWERHRTGATRTLELPYSCPNLLHHAWEPCYIVFAWAAYHLKNSVRRIVRSGSTRWCVHFYARPVRGSHAASVKKLPAVPFQRHLLYAGWESRFSVPMKAAHVSCFRRPAAAGRLLFKDGM